MAGAIRGAGNRGKFLSQIAYNSPSMRVAVRSFAKINLGLYIGAAHADGRVPLDKREGSVKAKISRAVPGHRFFRQETRGQTGRSLVFDITFWETWTGAPLKPDFGLSGFSSTHLRRAANPGSPAGPVLPRWGGSSIPFVAESATPATRRISPCTAAQSTPSPSPTSTSCTPVFPAPVSTDPPPAAGLPRATLPDVPPAPPRAPAPRPASASSPTGSPTADAPPPAAPPPPAIPLPAAAARLESAAPPVPLGPAASGSPARPVLARFGDSPPPPSSPIPHKSSLPAFCRNVT